MASASGAIPSTYVWPDDRRRDTTSCVDLGAIELAKATVQVVDRGIDFAPIVGDTIAIKEWRYTGTREDLALAVEASSIQIRRISDVSPPGFSEAVVLAHTAVGGVSIGKNLTPVFTTTITIRLSESATTRRHKAEVVHAIVVGNTQLTRLVVPISASRVDLGLGSREETTTN